MKCGVGKRGHCCIGVAYAWTNWFYLMNISINWDRISDDGPA